MNRLCLCARILPRQSLIAGATRPIYTATSGKTFSLPQFSRRSYATQSSQHSQPGKVHPLEAFLSGPSANYIEEMYAAWLKEPSSVHVSWQAYFKNLLANGKLSDKIPSFIPPPGLIPGKLGKAAITGAGHLNDGHVSPVGQEPTSILASTEAVEGMEKLSPKDIMDHMKVQLLVRAYQVRGHHLANLDPLGLRPSSATEAPELQPSNYGFSEADMSRQFFLGNGILTGFSSHYKTLSLAEIVDALKRIYCGTIGVEYAHIPDRRSCNWLRQRVEIPVRYQFTQQQKHMILDRLLWSDSFERFVATKYPSEKRFGLEGGESLIPGMKALIDMSVENGIETIVMGMPHRGRLNVLSNVVRKPNESIFSEFSGSLEPSVEGSGDVKYHLGMNYDRPTPTGKMVHLSLVANPSHLEAVDPVVQGKVRALQFYANDEVERGKAMALLLHGDAAFAAQGVVYETLGFADLPAYTTGGVVHIIVNNQVGFTTDPRFARSTPYCSDVAKTVSAPILHVNGDDVEAVVFTMQLAAEWRAKFKKDVVIDMVCYRKHGHNEVDQPSFTQPRMYQTIAKQKPVLEKYVEQLISEGNLTRQEYEAMKKRVWGILEDKYEMSKTYKGSSKEWLSAPWSGFKSPKALAQTVTTTHTTGVNEDLLRFVGSVISSYPKDFTVHNNLAKILKAREKAVKDGVGMDWATCEAMAFGTLVSEGIHVRLSGQDVERGTFSQRHAVLHDQKNEGQYVALNHIDKQPGGLVKEQAPFTVCNSSLSEFGTLGFELGYSLVSPHQLTLWEAQFGDFANNAQVVIDQFISSGEQKWTQRSALTMLLPHGYDGQGPEHSSARIERFLQLCDEDPYRMPDREGTARGSLARQHQDCNMQVVYPSVPSNYFHALRRQVHREFRKPLIVFESKALLRHPLARSSISEMAPGTRFQRLIPEVLHPSPLQVSPTPDPSAKAESVEFYISGNNTEPRLPHSLIPNENDSFKLLPPSETKTLILCSGQVYYLLLRARELNNLPHIAIVRVEQISPFPFWDVKDVIDYYPNLEEIVWCQEEHMNGGAWTYVEPRLETVIRSTDWWRSGKGRQWEEQMDSRRVGGGLSNFLFSVDKTITEAESVRGGRLVRYAGRDASAAPATGNKKQHIAEEQQLVSEALFNGRLKKPSKVVTGVPLWE